ncbi:TIR domain-containing protein [Sphingomonas hankyongi]|uniref:TIR domain-containing protein n=1 Tax=Sphingomonas hankyongi TaxID=2908209 RepID=A0ABT0S1V3_9SPHN|nr:TIR domain-containing protein [Sphingomonas hankyongi]
MARIFLSYAREDLAAAEAFSGALEQAGHEVWWDHHLRAGSRFSWDIDAALKGAEAVVVLWSKDSVESAWVQDEAAEGLEGSRLVPVTLDGSKPPLGFRQYHTIDLAGWRRGGALFAELIAAIGAKACGETASAPPPRHEIAPQQPTICVVPFANKSGDPDQDYFSDGITEDVITDLSKISAMSVIGHNTSIGLHGGTIDLKELTSQLGVTHVVEGTVRKAASRLRITAQLVEAANGRSLWAERYERELSDVFAIQDEISHAIVEALQLTLLPGEKTAIAEGRTTSAEAYDLYLKSRRLWPDGAAGDYRKSDEIARLCAQAVAIDPDYANAWALLAMANSELRFWQNRPVDAIGPAERAMELDPGMPEPHCVRARHFEEHGRIEEARAAVREALRLDPSSWEANFVSAQLMFRNGDSEAAIAQFEKAVGLGRKDHASASMLVSCRAAAGDRPGVQNAAQMSVAFAEAVVICDPTSGIAFASAARGFAALGEHDRARKWIHKALNVDPGNLAMRYSLASTLALFLKECAEAIEILEPFAEAAKSRPQLRLLEVDPAWAEIRGAAEFDAMLQRARKRVDAVAVSC